MTDTFSYAAVMCFLFILYRAAFGGFTRLSLFHSFFIAHIVAICVALPFLDNGTRYYEDFYFAALLTPLFLLVGGVFSRVFRFRRFNDSAAYVSLENLIVDRQRSVLLVLIVFIVFYVIDIGIKNSAIIFAVSNPGESSIAMELRMEALKSSIFAPLTKLYGYARSIFLPFLGAFLTVTYLDGRLSRKIYYLSLVLSVFYCAYSAAKAPVFYYFLAIALSYYWHRLTVFSTARKWMAIGKFSAAVLSALFASALLYPLLHGAAEGEVLAYALQSLFERVFEVPAVVALRYFEVFGSAIDHIGFGGNTVGAFLLGEDKVSSAQLLYGYFYNNRFSDQGLMNAAFFAGLYGDLGWSYMIIGITLTGVIIGVVEDYLRDLPADALRIAARAICTLAVMQLVLSDLTSAFFGRGLLTVPLLLISGAFIVRQLQR